jgi:Recombinase zinc beta ribbon domain
MSPSPAPICEESSSVAAAYHDQPHLCVRFRLRHVRRRAHAEVSDLVDEFAWEWLTIDVAGSIRSGRVIEALAQLVRVGGALQHCAPTNPRSSSRPRGSVIDGGRTLPEAEARFHRLLKCARCGCTMTAEKNKGKYVYYRCTGFKGKCGNTYMRQERLADLLGDVIKPIQITADIAHDIATALHATDDEAEQRRAGDLRQLDQRRKVAATKLDRGYDDLL